MEDKSRDDDLVLIIQDMRLIVFSSLSQRPLDARTGWGQSKATTDCQKLGALIKKTFAKLNKYVYNQLTNELYL